MLKKYAWLAAAVAFAVVGGIMASKEKEPRGYRNNNPGNIRHGDSWQGMADIQIDKEFVTFIAPEYGYRAMAKVLETYRKNYGLNSVYDIISRWAPPNENDTESYIESVAAALNVPPYQPLDETHLVPLIAAIAKHENGYNKHGPEVIGAGVALA